MKVKIDENCFAPQRAHLSDAGLDLFSPIDVTVYAWSSAKIDTGVHIELPKNTVGMLKSKSGLNVNHGILSEGVIDEGYTGSIMVKLYNNSPQTYSIHRGDKISQLVVLPVLYEEVDIVDELDDTDRGNDGFGSTGK